jgi:Lrp/AsnC family transcriptional regulator, leucine-responsive regulatory protein
MPGLDESNQIASHLLIDAGFTRENGAELAKSCVESTQGWVSCAVMAAHVNLDELDEQIIELLREDARRTLADIASRVNLSPAPVKRRIDRLEQLGVITGYTVSVNHALIGPSIEAFTELRFAGDADIDEILAAVEQIPEIREVFTMAGDPDALLRIRVNDVEHLKAVVNLLRRTGRVTGTKTLMVLDRWER